MNCLASYGRSTDPVGWSQTDMTIGATGCHRANALGIVHGTRWGRRP